MADPIQDSDIAKRNAEERRITLGAINDPENTKMADGQTVADFQRETYEAHLAEARAAEEIQIQRTREQSLANDPFYQGTPGFIALDAKGNASIGTAVVVSETFSRDALMTKTKAELVAIAEGQGVTVVPDSQTRLEIANAILAAHSA
jgi:hypothetical protein